MLRTDQLLHSASTTASRPNPGASLPGTLAFPQTGLAPAGCRKLVARLRHDRSFAVIAPELLDARGYRLSATFNVVRDRLEALGLAITLTAISAVFFTKIAPTKGCLLYTS